MPPRSRHSPFPRLRVASSTFPGPTPVHALQHLANSCERRPQSRHDGLGISQAQRKTRSLSNIRLVSMRRCNARTVTSRHTLLRWFMLRLRVVYVCIASSNERFCFHLWDALISLRTGIVFFCCCDAPGQLLFVNTRALSRANTYSTSTAAIFP
jgi:hypothetical protein